jgi:hypothetical protein
MAAIPTIAEADARQPSREPESLVGEHGPIVNGMKAALAPLGLRHFNLKRNKAADRLEDLCTPDGEPIPPNTLSARRRDLERRRLVMRQKGQRETARLARLPQAPKTNQSPHKAAFMFRWRSVGRLSRHADYRESLIYGGFLHVGSLKSAASSVDGRNRRVCCGPKLAQSKTEAPPRPPAVAEGV